MPNVLDAAKVTVLASSSDVASSVAAEIIRLVKQNNSVGRRTILCLATGSTPIGVYADLVQAHKEGLSFANVVSFNLDEYIYSPEQVELPESSFRAFMDRHLFECVDIPADSIHFLPHRLLPGQMAGEIGQQFEAAIEEHGGFDYALVGVGVNGHVAFNEPGTAWDSATRVVSLTPSTRARAAPDFFDSSAVPLEGFTMGMRAILAARRLVCMATGESKARAMVAAIEQPPATSCPASALRTHPNASFVLDYAAAEQLAQVVTPWVTGHERLTVDSPFPLVKRAIVWLSQRQGKPLHCLTLNDFLLGSLSGLVSSGSAGAREVEALTRRVAEDLTTRIVRVPPMPKARGNIVIFSPHPDDDVIQMGGTFRHLVDTYGAANVHTVYQTSGDIAVFDDEVIKAIDLAASLSPDGKPTPAQAAVLKEIAHKEPGAPDSRATLEVKGLIRRSEARAASRHVGLEMDNVHFLNLPFYESGLIDKNPVSEADHKIMLDTLQALQPTLVFAAGDWSDPHGTHRVCLRLLLEALRRHSKPSVQLLLYRGAWAEYRVDEADYLVPLSPTDVDLKERSIMFHESQLHPAPFPGPDPREFSVRARERNIATADQLKALGLPAFAGVEAFVKHDWTTKAAIE
jgi:glucosamine-6-phosphate deaminase